MRLNADIIYDNLRKDVSVDMSGQKEPELLLERPIFCLGDESVFLSNRLYIVMADRFPSHPIVKRGAVIVYVGDSMQLSYYQNRCCLLRIRENKDLFHIANLIQDIFDRYDAWDERLQEILDTTASIREMVEASYGIFENPLFVLDSDFGILGQAGFGKEAFPQQAQRLGDKSLDFPLLGQFLEERDLSIYEKKPILLNILDKSTLSTNLYYKEEYIGSLTIDYQLRHHRSSDITLSKYFAQKLVKALRKVSAASSNKRKLQRQALQDLVEGLPAGLNHHRALESADPDKQYVCAKIKLDSRLEQLPVGYLYNELETIFPHCMTFEYDASVIGIISIDYLQDESGRYQEKLRGLFQPFIHSVNMKVGVSDAFQNLLEVRMYYHQASAALENGNFLYPNQQYYIFQNFALTELIMNAVGDLPIEMYYSDGMRRLMQHDADAPVSYIDTLRVYLDQNMSIGKTAALLYVHRSTLLERIDRIKRELGTDLKDLDERLRIQILLKAAQVRDQIRSHSSK